MVSLIIQVVGAFIATVSAALTLELPRHLLSKIGFVGAGGYLAYLLLVDYNSVFAAFMAAFVITIISQIFARVFKAPVTMFYIPGFFPIVPGIAIYRTILYFIQGNLAQANYYFVQTLMVAGAIAIVIFLIDSYIEMQNHVLHQRRLRKRKNYDA